MSHGTRMSYTFADTYADKIDLQLMTPDLSIQPPLSLFIPHCSVLQCGAVWCSPSGRELASFRAIFRFYTCYRAMQKSCHAYKLHSHDDHVYERGVEEAYHNHN